MIHLSTAVDYMCRSIVHDDPASVSNSECTALASQHSAYPLPICQWYMQLCVVYLSIAA